MPAVSSVRDKEVSRGRGEGDGEGGWRKKGKKGEKKGERIDKITICGG